MNDAALQARVTRLRQLISEATPIRQQPASEAANRVTFDYYEFNTLPVELDRSWRSIALREIHRLVSSYDWRQELTRQLDQLGLCSLAQMDDTQLDSALERFRSLESCVQNGFDSPDAPPAR